MKSDPKPKKPSPRRTNITMTHRFQGDRLEQLAQQGLIKVLQRNGKNRITAYKAL